MNYHTVITANDLQPGSMKSVRAAGKDILLANVNGVFFAIARKCPHMGANLCRGKFVGSVVTCPVHGAAFDVTDGQVIKDPKLLFLKMKAKNAKTFSVKVVDDQVLVGLE